MANHEWEDVSYHGSPTYECRFCHVDQWKVNRGDASEECPRAEECLKREAEQEEMEERFEYQQMLAKIKRFQELHNKYGDKS